MAIIDGSAGDGGRYGSFVSSDFLLDIDPSISLKIVETDDLLNSEGCEKVGRDFESSSKHESDNSLKY